MAEERIGTADGEARTYWAWTELFRTFQVALDPKKLVLAAVGIFAMWVSWWLLAVIFYNSRSEPRHSDYDTAYYQKKYELSEPDAQKKADDEFNRDLAEYTHFKSLAGPDGVLRVAPWHERRGPNPFLLVTGQLRESDWRGGRPVIGNSIPPSSSPICGSSPPSSASVRAASASRETTRSKSLAARSFVMRATMSASR